MDDLRITQLKLDPNVTDLGIGQPAFDLLPLELMRQAAAQRLAEGDNDFLNYGYEQGDAHFRRALADFLTAAYDIPVTAASLMTTSGSSQALDLICTLFARSGDTVFVGEPTYFLALRIFADHDLNVVSLPIDRDGLLPEALAEALTSGQKPAFVYLVPTFQNPSGATLTPERRQKIVALSQEYGFYIVADEVYHLLDYDAPPPAPFAQTIDNGRVFSVGSFSKILAPGLRLGWVQAAPSLLERLTGSGLLDSGGGLNPFTSSLVRVVLEHGWQAEHLAGLKTTYGRRRDAMVEALEQHLDDIAHFATPPGGFYVWLSLPESIDTAEFLPFARQHGVIFKPGSQFSAHGGCRHQMRLCFAFYDEAAIRVGIKRLETAVRAWPTVKQ